MSGAGRLGDRRRELRKPSLTLAVVAGIIATASCGAPAEPPTPADLLAELERALPSRIVEPRLSIRQPAEGCTPIPEEYTATCTFPESGSREYLRLAQATNDAQTAGRAGGSAENLHLEGLALILWSPRQEGTVRRAVTRLEAAAELAPLNPHILSDLAAAYLEAARQTESHYHLPRALDAALRALELDPDHAPALFNVALALERMGLPEASNAWQRYINQEQVPQWIAQAEVHRTSLQGRLDASIANSNVRVLMQDAEQIARVALADPQAVRTLAMDELLPEWALLEEVGDTAAAEGLLRVVRVAASALSDRTLTEALSELDAMRYTGQDRNVAQLRQGLLSLGEGREMYRKAEHRQAQVLFRRATAQFQEAGSTLALWSDFWLANTALGLLNYEMTRDLITNILALSPPDRPTLVGLSHRVLGVVEARQGRLGHAAGRYASAIRELSRAREAGYLASLWGLNAEILKALGSVRGAWEGRVEALRIHGPAGRPEAHPILFDAADAARREGLPLASGVLYESLLEVSQAIGVPAYVAEARIRRGQLRLLVGDTTGALKEGDESARALDSVSEQPVAAWLQADLSRLLASTLPETPAGLEEAMRLLDPAIAAHESAGHGRFVTGLLSDRSRVRWKAGREGYLDDVERAIQHLGRSAEAAAWADRVRFAETTRELLLRVGEMVAEGGADEWWGLARVEALAAIGSPPEGRQGLPPRPSDFRIPESVAILRYLILPDRVLLWVVTDGAAHLSVIPGSAADIEQAIDVFLDLVRSAPEFSALLDPALELRGLLIPAPLWPLIGGRDVVIVPDGALARVPFGTLPGPSGALLLDERKVASSPSVLMAGLEGSDSFPGERTAPLDRITLVGQSLSMPDLGLPALPGVDLEIEELARIHANPVVLMDGQATRSAFLAQFPQTDVLHFAGHAVSVPFSEAGSFLSLHPDESSDGTGRVYAMDLLGHSPPPKLVILTACASTAHDGGVSGGFWGVALPLLHSGTSSVIGTLWNVSDQETAQFSILLHEELAAGGSAADVLRAAQRRALLEGRLRPSVWSSFQVLVAGG